METSDVLRRVSVLWRTVHPGVTMMHWTVNQAGIQAPPCRLKTEMMCLYILICMQDGGVKESAGPCQSFYLSMCYFLLLPDNICTKLWGFSKHFHAYIYRLCYDCLPLTIPFFLTLVLFSLYITFCLNVNLLLVAMYMYDDDGVCVCVPTHV